MIGLGLLHVLIAVVGLWLTPAARAEAPGAPSRRRTSPSAARISRPSGPSRGITASATRSGVIIDQISITQIAALVLYSLGVPIPTDLDGEVPAEVFPAVNARSVRDAVAIPVTAPVLVRAAGAP